MPLLPLVPGQEQFDVVENRLHPGSELLLDVAREETQVAPHREDRAGNQEARVDVLLGGLLQAGRDGE